MALPVSQGLKISWCPEPDSNRQESFLSSDFKSDVFTNFTIRAGRAKIITDYLDTSETAQTSSAYWLMVRSLENLPILATLSIARPDQSS